MYLFFPLSAEADFSMSMMKKKMEVLENERIEKKITNARLIRRSEDFAVWRV